MSIKMELSAALGAAALLLPVVAAAQPPYGQPYSDGYRPQTYGYAQRRWDGGVYPEFREMEARIRRLIDDGVREDLIERDDARDLVAQLRRIQDDERREFAVHGWNLPEDDRERLYDRLARLDQLVDEIREEE